MRSFSLLCILMLLTGSARAERDDTCGNYEKTLNRIESVRLEDGVSQEEAGILAENYFAFFVSGCGGASLPADRGASWAFQARQGLGGLVIGEVLVDKMNGTVSFKGHPTVLDPVNVLATKQRELMKQFGCDTK